MLIKSASVLMCYSRIKRWNGFLHCSLGTGLPVLAPVHFTVRVVRMTYCYSLTLFYSYSLCVSNILDIFWRCPKLFILYPHKTNADWNQLLHLWPVFRCQNYRGVNSKIFSQKWSFLPKWKSLQRAGSIRAEFEWVNVPNSAILAVGAWCTFKFMSLT